MRYQVPIVLAIVLSTGASARGAPDEGRVREELREVFERPEFQSGPRERDSALGRALDSAADWLGGLRAAAPLVFWLLLLVLGGLLLVLFLYLGFVVRRASFVRRRSGETHEEARRQLSAGLRAEADELSRSADYTAAVRCLFLALVYAFDESGRLLFQPALTNREYLRGFTDRPILKTGLRVFVDVLDDNWYGQRLTTGAQYRECLTLYERLRPQA